MDYVLIVINSARSNEISAFFFWVILSVFVTAFLVLVYETKKRHLFVELTPGLLTTLGIVGTFTGIFIGLLDFDIDQINESVPRLIDGLKIAFSTSVIGLTAALVFRVIRIAQSIIRRASGVEQTTAEELIDAIKSVESNTREGFENLSTSFAEAFAKNFAEELQRAIETLNEQIKNELAKSFIELRISIEKIVEWQEKNLEYMKEMVRALNKSVESIKNCEESLKQISEAASSIPEQLDNLNAAYERLVETYNAWVELHNELVEQWGSIAEMRDTVLAP